MIRVIFDRSAFHGQNFLDLQRSRLEALCDRGMIQVFHTPVFLEETLDMFGVEANREEMRRQLPYIIAIANGGMFWTIREIWHDELVQNRGTNARLLWTPRERAQFENDIQRAPLKSDDWRYWSATAAERDDKHLKKNNQKDAYRDVREGLTERLRANGHRRPLSSYTFAEHLASELDLYGRIIIGSQIPSKNTMALQNQWSRNKPRYPFMTAFVEGFAYAGYYAAIEQNSPLDRNAQADYEQMTYLHAADVLVSADTRFLGDAFVEHGDNAVDRHNAMRAQLDYIVGEAANLGIDRPTVKILLRTLTDTTAPEGLFKGDLDSLIRAYKGKLEIAAMTMHGSKGLEGDFVILAGLESGFRGFPDERPREWLLDMVLPPLADPIEEERRLFYVGLTRARHKAIVLSSALRPSAFVLELARLQRHCGDAIEWEHYTEVRKPCPVCRTGSMLPWYHRETCSRYSVCGYKD